MGNVYIDILYPFMVFVILSSFVGNQKGKNHCIYST